MRPELPPVFRGRRHTASLFFVRKIDDGGEPSGNKAINPGVKGQSPLKQLNPASPVWGRSPFSDTHSTSWAEALLASRYSDHCCNNKSKAE